METEQEGARRLYTWSDLVCLQFGIGWLCSLAFCIDIDHSVWESTTGSPKTLQRPANTKTWRGKDGVEEEMAGAGGYQSQPLTS